MAGLVAPKFQGHVLIIGGGVAGPALALFLKKASISSAIYEAYPYNESIGGGFGLAPNGMNVLAALGLAEKVKAAGSVTLDNVFYNEKGRVIASFKNGSVARYGQPAVSLLRPALNGVIKDEIKSQGIEIHYEKRLKAITYNDTGAKVTAHFADGTQAEGDILIGADGIHSQTRNLTMPDAPKPAYVGIIGVGGAVPASAVPNMTLKEKQSFSFTFGAKGFFGYCGIANGDVMWWSNLPSKKEFTREELSNLSLDTIKKDMLEIYTGYHEPIETLIKNTFSPIKLNVSDIQSLPVWSKGRVLLIGDAAHAVSPNAGQGASMAFEDTQYLAMLLRDVPGYQEVFRRFEQDRKPRVEKIVAEGRKRGEDKIIVTPFQAKIREFFMRVFIPLTGEKSQDWLFKYRLIGRHQCLLSDLDDSLKVEADSQE